jgi:hypothetical protein
LKQFPPACRHRSHRLLYFWNASGSPFLSVWSTLRFGLDLLSGIKPVFSLNLIFGSRNKSQGAKSGEYGGWGMTAILYFARNCWVKTELWDWALSWLSNYVCLAKVRREVFTRFHAVAAKLCIRIHSLACWYKFFVLPQLLYRWRHQSRIFWIPSCVFPAT